MRVKYVTLVRLYSADGLKDLGETLTKSLRHHFKTDQCHDQILFFMYTALILLEKIINFFHSPNYFKPGNGCNVCHISFLIVVFRSDFTIILITTQTQNFRLNKRPIDLNGHLSSI